MGARRKPDESGEPAEKAESAFAGIDIEVFMTETLKGSDGIAAISAAGYAGDKANASRLAWRLRNRKYVREELRRRHDEMIRRSDLPTDETVERELHTIAFGDYPIAERVKALIAIVRIRGKYGVPKKQEEPLNEEEFFKKLESFALIHRSRNEDELPALEAPVTDQQLEEDARQAATLRARDTSKRSR